MKYKKRSSLPLYAILSIVISLVGIGLFLALIGKNSDIGTKVYCRTMYDGSNDDPRDEYCKDYLEMDVDYLPTYSNEIIRFSSGRKSEVLEFFFDNQYRDVVTFQVPKGIRIKEASLNIQLTNQTLKNFDDERSNEIIIFPIGRPVLSKRFVNMPIGSNIISASMECSGAEYPSKAQIVFLVDTSGSMKNEWNALCSIIDEVLEEFDDMGLEIISYDILGLSDGTTTGRCLTGIVSEEDMEMILDLDTVSEVIDHGGYVDPWDDYREAWALGCALVVDRYDWSWDSDVKRIVIPISDSDPTGGGQVSYDWSGWHGPVYFSGTEQSVIDMTVDRATNPPEEHIFLIPVAGDEDSENNEGYGIGSVPCEGICSDVKAWMDRLAIETGSIDPGDEIPGFEDKDTIINTVHDVLISSYPANVEITINSGRRELNIAVVEGELDNIASPYPISGFESFVEDECCGNMCRLDVTSDEGTVILDRLRIVYTMDPEISSIYVDGFDVDIPVNIDLDGGVYSIDIAEELRKAIDECEDTMMCEIQVMVKGTEDGSITMGIDIDYEIIDLEGELIGSIYSCMNSFKGGYEDVLCEELIVDENYEFDHIITEELLTDIISEKNLCYLLPNEEYGCGESDSFDLGQDLYNVRNILIEYSAESDKVIVS